MPPQLGYQEQMMPQMQQAEPEDRRKREAKLERKLDV